MKRASLVLLVVGILASVGMSAGGIQSNSPPSNGTTVQITHGGTGSSTVPAPGSIPIVKNDSSGAVWAVPSGDLVMSLLGAFTVTASGVRLTDAPMWMHYLGDGTEADPNCSTTLSVEGTHYYANLTVQAGCTVTVTSSSAGPGASINPPLAGWIAISTGTITIAGIVNANALVGASANAYYLGATGGGGGYGAANGAAGFNSIPFNAIGTIIGGGAAGTPGVAGGIGATPSAAAQLMAAQNLMQVGFCGGSKGGLGGSAGGAAGPGGGCIWFIAPYINFTGSLHANGGDGVAGGLNTGGGGGGGGGAIGMAAKQYLANSGTMTVTGGLAGAIGTGTSTAGGPGALGWTKQWTLN